MKPRRPGPDYHFESRYGGQVAGVDEAGRGPLAGPVVAAAVVLDPKAIPDGLDDSKKLTEHRREQLFADIMARAIVGVASIGPEEIDRLNILQASLLAMERAVAALPSPPEHVLVDGNRTPKWMHSCEAIVGGDAKCLSIAAASIIAKVTRDREMRVLDAAFPAYGWAKNKGYPTRLHVDAIARVGVSVHHRKSFGPVRARLERI